MAHDFNNLLTVVIGNTELLLENLAADDASRSLAQTTLSAARSGADLIRTLLAYARHQPMQLVEFDANALIGETIDLLGRSLGPYTKIETTLAAGLWGVRADRAQLGSALLNLAINARDAMPETGGTLTIATQNLAVAKKSALAQKLPAGHWVLITVSDTGIGMAQDVLARAFEPFFTTKTPGRGTGLGLSMVDKFARQSGGQLRIASAPGAGTAVGLYLPRADIQLDLPHIAGEDALRPAREGETVLVVEENAAVRAILAEQLRRLGYGVIAAGDVKSGLKELRQAARVDLLLSNIDGAGKNAARLAERAKRSKPSVKILFTSAHGAGNGDAKSGAQHDYRVLAKPYRKQELAEALRITLDEIL